MVELDLKLPEALKLELNLQVKVCSNIQQKSLVKLYYNWDRTSLQCLVKLNLKLNETQILLV